VHIFTHPGDTKGDTKLSTVFVSTQPMIALASSRGKQFATHVGDEITGVAASPYLSGVFGATSAASFWKRDKISNVAGGFLSVGLFRRERGDGSPRSGSQNSMSLSMP
jgi:hypothetical protein